MEIKNDVLVSVDNYDINSDGTFDFPYNVKKIGEGAFKYCYRLTSLTIPENVTSIGDNAFYNCESLKEVTLPASLTKIGDEAFLECKNLKKIDLKEGIQEIGSNAFEECTSLEMVAIPSSVNEIKMRTFFNCKNLKEVKLNSNIKIIGTRSFENCTSLEKIELKEGLQIIDYSAFYKCKSLKTIDVPSSVTYIGANAFSEAGLSNITFKGEQCELKSGILDDCRKLQTVKLKGKVKFSSKDLNECNKLKTIIINDQTIELKDIQNRFFGNNNALIINTLSKGNVSNRIKWPIHFLNSLSGEDMNNLSTKFFEEIYNSYKEKFEKMSIEDINCLFKFAYYIGCFNNEIDVINRRNTNVAQKSCDFLKRVLDREIIKLDDFRSYFEKLEIKKYNPNFINFITQKEKIDGKETYSNFEFLLSKSQICTILNDFDKIDRQKIVVDGLGKTNNHPTIKNKIYSYIYYPAFKSMEEEDKVLAETLSSEMNIKEHHFLEAKEILKKAKEGPHHILNEELKEDIENLKQKIKQEFKESKTNLDLLFNKEFSYEWLDKHDIDNLILGSYCDCCATITGQIEYGKQILKTAMVMDNEQNLVIKNYNDRIIAKATIYVNKRYGYAVFNDIELNTKYGNERFEDAKDDPSTREKIYETFKRGVYDFVKKYNEKNEVPIKQVNIGWGNNRLKQTIKKIEKKPSKVLLDVPSYFQDAEKEQWTIYKESKKRSER